MRQKFWYFIHNAIAHPLLVLGFEWTDSFHDWSADKLSIEYHLDRIHQIKDAIETQRKTPRYIEWRDKNYKRYDNDLLYRITSPISEAIIGITDDECKAEYFKEYPEISERN
jgi:hypothetical protein